MAPRRFQPFILPDRHAGDSEKGAEYRHSWTYMVVWGQGGSLVDLARCGAASSSPGIMRMTRAGIRRDWRRKARFRLNSILILSLRLPYALTSTLNAEIGRASCRERV